MREALKKLVRKAIPKRIVELITHDLKNSHRQIMEFTRLSFSQDGEDMVLASLLDKTSGFYIDVGAHHPRRYSNTSYFYMQGWRGINIDATPGSMTLFNEQRERDINLELGVSDDEGSREFYIFQEGALNTFDRKLAERYQDIGNRLSEVRKVKAKTLSSILDEHLPAGQFIDFMNIDVELRDIHVLRSNNWDRYRPAFILIEDARFDTRKAEESEVFCFLRDQNYHLVSLTKNTLFFASEN